MCRVRPWLGTIGLQRSTGEAAAESIVSEVGDETHDCRGIRRKQVQNKESLKRGNIGLQRSTEGAAAESESETEE